MTQALITVPNIAARGDVVEVRCLLGHPMESGFRTGVDGKLLARNIVTSLRCSFRNSVVFDAQLMPSVSANPYVSFHLRIEQTGVLRVQWTGDQSFSHAESVTITVKS